MFTSLQTNKLLFKPAAIQQLCFVFKSSKDILFVFTIDGHTCKQTRAFNTKMDWLDGFITI